MEDKQTRYIFVGRTDGGRTDTINFWRMYKQRTNGHCIFSEDGCTQDEWTNGEQMDTVYFRRTDEWRTNGYSVFLEDGRTEDKRTLYIFGGRRTENRERTMVF